MSGRREICLLFSRRSSVFDLVAFDLFFLPLFFLLFFFLERERDALLIGSSTGAISFIISSHGIPDVIVAALVLTLAVWLSLADGENPPLLSSVDLLLIISSDLLKFSETSLLFAFTVSFVGFQLSIIISCGFSGSLLSGFVSSTFSALADFISFGFSD